MSGSDVSPSLETGTVAAGVSVSSSLETATDTAGVSVSSSLSSAASHFEFATVKAFVLFSSSSTMLDDVPGDEIFKDILWRLLRLTSWSPRRFRPLAAPPY